MYPLHRIAVMAALVGVVALSSASPAEAVVHKRTCERRGGNAGTGWYGVNICIKIEYLPGGVRSLLAYDCFLVLLAPYREVDAACNYEAINLRLYDGGLERSVLEYGHITGKGYYQFASPWFKCDENKTTTYHATVSDTNVRYPNGQLDPTDGRLATELPDVTISCA